MLLAIILGLVEGITEFIPVSSTGHLILAGHLLGFTGERAATFEIFIQLGAILAVVVVYPARFIGFLRPHPERPFSGAKGQSMLFLSTLPALVLGFLLHKYIKTHLFNPYTVAIGLVGGGFWILWTERHRKHKVVPRVESLDAIEWQDALKIGLFQCLALWPGFSRSGATILGGMALGLDRKTAAEYSFFAAVPVLAAATVLDLAKSISLLQPSDLPFFAVGLFVSFISAWIVIRMFIGFVSNSKLTPFGWYRLVVAALVLLFWNNHS